MTITPSNHLAMKLTAPLLRMGSVRWYEAVNTMFLNLMHSLSGQVRVGILYESSPETTVHKGRLITFDTAIPVGDLDSLAYVDNGTPGHEIPMGILDEHAESPSSSLWYYKTVGKVEFDSAHGITPGTVGYRNDSTPGEISTSGTVAVGIYLQDKGFLFLPHLT